MNTDQKTAFIILSIIVIAYTLHKLPEMITLLKAWYFRKSNEERIQDDLNETENTVRSATTLEEVERIEVDALIWYTMLGPAYKVYYDRLRDVTSAARRRIQGKQVL